LILKGLVKVLFTVLFRLIIAGLPPFSMGKVAVGSRAVPPNHHAGLFLLADT
jgi:hypothetical protein